jgi:hypothetical protein
MKEKVSDCCQSPAIDGYEEVGVCPDCKEDCEFIEVEDDEPAVH